MIVPERPPTLSEAMAMLSADPAMFGKMLASAEFRPTVSDRYLHWEKLRRKTPPPGLTSKQWWAMVKFTRVSLWRQLPFTSTDGKHFKVAIPDPLQRALSEADRNLSGRVAIPDQIANPGTRDRYLMSALVEEAITSSQLEGASTTRKVATEMLRTGRQPVDASERMIYNNYLAMRFIRKTVDQPLTVELIREMQRRITDGTLDDPADAGSIRTSDDIKVYGAGGEVLHAPPPAKTLKRRLDTLCRFANETPEKDRYLHPIVRAVLLHFMLAYDHPFVDGNGRTARALFYWSMLRSGYWLSEFLSISMILRKSPAKYALSYLYTETDENDTTYFVLHQLDVLHRAIEALHEYVKKKIRDMQRTQDLLRYSQEFNHRQLALLTHALRNPDASYTVSSHANSHMVARPTARTDLKELAARGLLLEFRGAGKGGPAGYRPAPDLEDKVERVKSRS